MKIGRSIGTAIAAHNILKTGVHSVGASYLSKTSQSDQTLSDTEIPAAIARDLEVVDAIAFHAAIATAHQNAPALITAHSGAVDPHADRAYTDTEIAKVQPGVGLEATVALFQANVATGTFATNPQNINDNNTATWADAQAVDQYAEVDFGKVVCIRRWRQWGAVGNTGNGRWKIQYYNLVTHAWADWVTDIPTSTIDNWGELSTEPEVLTDKIRLVCTTVDPYGTANRSLIVELEVIY